MSSTDDDHVIANRIQIASIICDAGFPMYNNFLDADLQSNSLSALSSLNKFMILAEESDPDVLSCKAEITPEWNNEVFAKLFESVNG